MSTLMTIYIAGEVNPENYHKGFNIPPATTLKLLPQKHAEIKKILESSRFGDSILLVNEFPYGKNDLIELLKFLNDRFSHIPVKVLLRDGNRKFGSTDVSTPEEAKQKARDAYESIVKGCVINSSNDAIKEVIGASPFDVKKFFSARVGKIFDGLYQIINVDFVAAFTTNAKIKDFYQNDVTEYFNESTNYRADTKSKNDIGLKFEQVFIRNLYEFLEGNSFSNKILTFYDSITDELKFLNSKILTNALNSKKNALIGKTMIKAIVEIRKLGFNETIKNNDDANTMFRNTHKNELNIFLKQKLFGDINEFDENKLLEAIIPNQIKEDLKEIYDYTHNKFTP